MTISETVTVDQVIDRMRQLQASLPPGDGVAVFNGMYLTVTELVQQRLGASYFDDPAAMARLDAVFAGRWLAAVDAVARGARPTACWRPLFELRGHRGIHPLQFALAGMNAHIEHDLPLSVVDLCRELGREPAEVEADYLRINALLAQVEDQVRDELLPGPEQLDLADPLLHVIGVWSIDRARDAAWASALALWELRELPFVGPAFRTALDGSVGMVSRALLTPLNGRGRLPA
ncbi:hypothetical protein F4556_000744 [Kitasatospora gansuensis]|uniref:Uncharacterized protein n=1 Tax=Kitasatospora gansuensis TaxID=258050 RepID=A0A7W7WG89_9ACTN|nr:DUF5995 family protein [Kitasatospora gansuensis]MBB4945209.1 hypothetical protein [Kitasatospora gansuensis]